MLDQNSKKNPPYLGVPLCTILTLVHLLSKAYSWVTTLHCTLFPLLIFSKSSLEYQNEWTFFCLLWTWFLLSLKPAKFKLERDKKIKFIQLFQTRFFKNQVHINRGFVSNQDLAWIFLMRFAWLNSKKNPHYSGVPRSTILTSPNFPKWIPG